MWAWSPVYGWVIVPGTGMPPGSLGPRPSEPPPDPNAPTVNPLPS
jgi:hypothetical protein